MCCPLYFLGPNNNMQHAYLFSDLNFIRAIKSIKACMIFRHLERTKNLLFLSACCGKDFNGGITSNPVNSHLREVLALLLYLHFAREQADSGYLVSPRGAHWMVTHSCFKFRSVNSKARGLKF